MNSKINTEHNEESESVPCPFCGKDCHYKAITLGELVIKSETPERCDCEQAKIHFAEVDAQIERKEREEAEAKERERKTARINRILGKSGMKKRFMQRTFERFEAKTAEQKKCLKKVAEYAENFAEYAGRGEGLFIVGPNGTGKTHLAAATALHLISKGVPVVCKTSENMLSDIKRAFDSKEATEYEVLKAYKDVDLLIVDDLGKEQCTDWSISTLYSILNDRYEDMKPTIITTNYSGSDLTEALTPKGYGDDKIKAIVSRLREVSEVVKMDWEDYRRAKNA